MLGTVSGHGHAVGSVPGQDTGVSRTRHQLALSPGSSRRHTSRTSPTSSLGMGQAQWHHSTQHRGQGTATWLGCWAGGHCGGQCRRKAGQAALTWLKRCDRTVSGSVLVRPESCGENTSSYCPTVAGSCPGTAGWHRMVTPSPREPPGLGGVWGHAHLGSCPVNPAFAVGVDVHEDQPFNQVREDELHQARGVMLSGKGQQAHQHHCPPCGHHSQARDIPGSPGINGSAGPRGLTWRDGRPGSAAAGTGLPCHRDHSTAILACPSLQEPLQWHSTPGPSAPALPQAPGWQEAQVTPSQPQAHRKLGQHVGSCPNADPDHILEPGKQRGTHGETVGSSAGSPGHPSAFNESRMGHKRTCRVPANGGKSSSPSPSRRPCPARSEER